MTRRETYLKLLREERANIVPSGRVGNGKPFVTGGQVSAAKARATKRFLLMEREGHFG